MISGQSRAGSGLTRRRGGTRARRILALTEKGSVVSGQFLLQTEAYVCTSTCIYPHYRSRGRLTNGAGRASWERERERERQRQSEPEEWDLYP